MSRLSLIAVVLFAACGSIVMAGRGGAGGHGRSSKGVIGLNGTCECQVDLAQRVVLEVLVRRSEALAALVQVVVAEVAVEPVARRSAKEMEVSCSECDFSPLIPLPT